MGDRLLHIFEQRIELEAHVPVVALGLFPHREKNLLGRLHQVVIQPPGNGLVVQALLGQLGDVIVKRPGFDDLGDNDRIGRRAAGTHGTVFLYVVGLNAIYPDFRSRRD